MKKWVIGDIHGEYDKLKTVIELANVDLDNDMVIQLGDIVDRGAEPFKCIDLLKTIKNIIFIKGNHDDEFLNMIETYNKYGTNNGGFGGHHGSDVTLNKWIQLSSVEQLQYQLFFKNEQLYYFVMENKLFIHGGFNRHLPIEEQYNQIFLWDRDFIMAAMSYKNMAEDISKYPFRIKDGYSEVYIGHTPTQYFKSDKPIVCGGDKVYLIDTGAGKFEKTGTITIMNIETKEFYQA